MALASLASLIETTVGSSIVDVEHPSLSFLYLLVPVMLKFASVAL